MATDATEDQIEFDERLASIPPHAASISITMDATPRKLDELHQATANFIASVLGFKSHAADSIEVVEEIPSEWHPNGGLGACQYFDDDWYAAIAKDGRKTFVHRFRNVIRLARSKPYVIVVVPQVAKTLTSALTDQSADSRDLVESAIVLLHEEIHALAAEVKFIRTAKELTYEAGFGVVREGATQAAVGCCIDQYVEYVQLQALCRAPLVSPVELSDQIYLAPQTAMKRLANGICKLTGPSENQFNQCFEAPFDVVRVIVGYGPRMGMYLIANSIAVNHGVSGYSNFISFARGTSGTREFPVGAERTFMEAMLGPLANLEAWCQSDGVNGSPDLQRTRGFEAGEEALNALEEAMTSIAK